MMVAAERDTAERVARVRAMIDGAAVRAGRASDDVRLVAVSKTQGPERVVAAVEAGVVDFGENRVQEAVAKAEVVAGTDGRVVRWHLIGPLQSNKVGGVVNRGWWIHTLDRPSIIDRVARLSVAPSEQPVLVQVNVGRDPAKAGCTVDEAPALVDQAVAAGLDVRGLMTIVPLPGPRDDPNDAARPHFAALRALRDRIVVDHPGLTELSMGMSNDLESAIAEGATLVRVGTGVFGPRQATPWQPGADG